MKTIIPAVLVALLLFCSFNAGAVSMGQLIGRVTINETGQPLPGAEIIFENKLDKITIRADEHGYYYSNHMPTGRYQLRIIYNERTFVMNRVRVYDSYTSEVNFPLSNNNELPALVVVPQQFPMASSVETTDIRLADDANHQPTRTLGEALSNYAGVEVINGQVYVNGGGQVRFFIDGSPVIGPTSLGRFW